MKKGISSYVNLTPKNQSKEDKDYLAYYDPYKQEVHLNVYNYFFLYPKRYQDESFIEKNICQDLYHEYLHVAIDWCRKDLEQCKMFDFFEEYLIFRLVGIPSKFDLKNYFYIINENPVI